jgi:hypothetical protein
MTVKRKIIPILILSLVTILIGCQEHELTGKELKDLLDVSLQHSAVSYWYMGKKDRYHYIQERWPIKTRNKFYKISEVEIFVNKNLRYNKDKAEWINLKLGDIKFLKL